MTFAVIDALDSSIRHWGAGLSWPGELVLRLLLAATAGGLVGVEREVRGRQAGFRTNLLVCVGSALVMIISVSFADRRWEHHEGINLNVDPARIAYGVMTGIGFLCAGTIIRPGTSVRGLTTAAAIWCVAAVGLAAGFGMYTLTVIATVIIVMALWILDYVETLIPRTHHRLLVLRRRWGAGCVDESVARLQHAGFDVHDVNFKRTNDLQWVDISMRAAFRDPQKYNEFQRQLEEDKDTELMSSEEE